MQEAKTLKKKIDVRIWVREGVSEDLKRIVDAIAVGRDSPDPKCTLGGGLRR